MTKELN
jgi:hypothetical protein